MKLAKKNNVKLNYSNTTNQTYNYAVDELTRLLTKAGVTVETIATETDYQDFVISLGAPAEPPGNIQDIQHDGYAINVTVDGITLFASQAKGVLNAVYDLLERIGYLFLLPDDEGEWAPSQLLELPKGVYLQNPRFPHRGVFREEANGVFDYSPEKWFEFYAKLRFNAVTLDRPELLPLAAKLGLRMEIGGHGFSKLLPRDLFDEKPELFRMFQPEDFNGKRMPDSNLCVTNPKTKNIVKENFKKKLAEIDDVYAYHLWPDDLPAGGWCLCPSCRAFAPEDQAMLAMKIIADETKTAGRDLKIPFLAYHDTMLPGKEIDVSDNMFLLFAPRERCYAHALDDPTCTRNRFYFDALKKWVKKFDGIEDSHTFEYYFDQILFRGIYPYLPKVITDDMRVYEKQGIECHLSLQVASNCIAPEYNLLLFASAHWGDEHFEPDTFVKNLAERADTALADVWFNYLQQRGEVFTNAFRMCDHNLKIYLDYRWLPETRSDFSIKNAAAYLTAAEKLKELSRVLVDAQSRASSQRMTNLIKNEIRRLAFEAAEFGVMHHQQLAVCKFAEYQNSANQADCKKGIEQLKLAITALEESLQQALQFGLSPKGWYARNINAWLTKEFNEKIDTYSSK